MKTVSASMQQKNVYKHRGNVSWIIRRFKSDMELSYRLSVSLTQQQHNLSEERHLIQTEQETRTTASSSTLTYCDATAPPVGGCYRLVHRNVYSSVSSLYTRKFVVIMSCVFLLSTKWPIKVSRKKPKRIHFNFNALADL